MDKVQRLLAALVCAAVCQASHAERSRLDEDVAERGDCEIELVAERRKARGAATDHETALQLDCGIGWRTELKAAVARQRGGGGERSQSIDIEARTALFDRNVAGVAWSIAYGLSGERAAGGSWQRSGHFVALSAALRPAEAWLLEAELGWQRDRIDRREAWAWKLGLEHEISDRLEARAEIDGSNRNRPFVGAELRYEFWPDRARLNLGYAARSGPARERRLGVGVAFEF